MNISKLKESISTVTDPRRSYGNLRHKIEDIIIIGLLATICLGEDFVDMETFGKEREDWLKTILELPDGIPDSDTFRRLFERLNPGELSECLNCLIVAKRDKGSVINVNGKTIRGSKNADHKAYHVVSAWVFENQITLGEIKTDEKSNEITAIPDLLDAIDVADYVIGLKGDQSILRDDVSLYFEDFVASRNLKASLEKDHGRIEQREYFLETDIDWLLQKSKWSNLKAIGMVKTTVEEKDKVRCETRYFITSLSNVDDFAIAVRKHWSIENQLHWCLDVVFREDEAKARKDNSPLNMNIIRKFSLSLLKKIDLGRIGLRKKMFKAALNHSILSKIVFGSEQK